MSLQGRLTDAFTAVGAYIKASVMPRLLPTGGSTGQVVAKTSGGYGWVNAPAGEGGGTGFALMGHDRRDEILEYQVFGSGALGANGATLTGGTLLVKPAGLAPELIPYLLSVGYALENATGNYTRPAIGYPATIAEYSSLLEGQSITRFGYSQVAALNAANLGELVEITTEEGAPYVLAVEPAQGLGEGWYCYVKNAGACTVTMQGTPRAFAPSVTTSGVSASISADAGEVSMFAGAGTIQVDLTGATAEQQAHVASYGFSPLSGDTWSKSMASATGPMNFEKVWDLSTTNGNLQFTWIVDYPDNQFIDALPSVVLYPGETRLVRCDGSNFETLVVDQGSVDLRQIRNSGGRVIDCSIATVHKRSVVANTLFQFLNVPAKSLKDARQDFTFKLILTHSSGTITWPTAVLWPGGAAPSLTTNKTHLFWFTTSDGGLTWRGACLPNYAS